MGSKMRFIFILYNYRDEPQFADTLRIHRILNSLKTKNKITILTNNNKLILDSYSRDKLKIIRLPSINIKIVRKLLFLISISLFGYKIIKKENPDVIFINDIATNRVAKKFNRKSNIWWDIMGIRSREKQKENSSSIKYLISLYYKLCENKMYNYSSLITVINEAHKKFIKNSPNKDILVLRDGVLRRDIVLSNRFKNKIKDGEINLIFIGSLINNRLYDLIFITKDLLTKTPNLKINVWGDGPDKKRYIQLSKKINTLNKNIFFKGYTKREEILSNLKQSDVCYSDDWSYLGFPTKVYEYMLMSKPIILEDTPATREVIRDGYSGLLYKTKNELKDKIILLSKHKRLRLKLGENAKKEVISKYVWDDQILKINNYLTSLIK